MTTHSRDAGPASVPGTPEDALFALPANQPPTTTAARPRPVPDYVPTNDLALIRHVLDQAADPGYLLIGEHVLRQCVRHSARVERTTPDEANAVRQLLDRRFLARGAARPARYGLAGAPVIPLLLTASARAQIRRGHIHLVQDQEVSAPARRVTPLLDRDTRARKEPR